jgi:Zn-dependent protease with chaperone function
VDDRTPWPAVPGPVDRETFYHAQRRHRRARFGLSVATVISTAIAGSPMAIMICPYLLIAVILALDVVNFVVPMPDPYADLLNATLDETDGRTTLRGPGDLAAVTGVLLASGAITAVLSWLMLRRFLWIGSRAGMLAHLDTRARRRDDLREVRFVNAVEEIAVAAGIQPPQVAIGRVRNAAVFGSSRKGYVVVVSPHILEELSRDELQAVAAYLVASAGNGDLGMAMTTSAAALVNDFAPILMSWPFSRRARSLLGRLLRPSTVGPAEFHDTLDALGDIENSVVGDADSGLLPAVASLAGILAWLMNAVTQVVALCVVRPWLGAFWRRRSALADADAVELTRHPDGLASALRRLARSTRRNGHPSPLEHLSMVVGEEGGLGFRGGAGSGWGMLPPTVRPKLAKRLRRLRRLGAQVGAPAGSGPRHAAPEAAGARPADQRPSGGQLAIAYAKAAGILVALVALLPIGVFLVVQAMFLAICFTLCGAATVLAPVHYLLRALAG